MLNYCTTVNVKVEEFLLIRDFHDGIAIHMLPQNYGRGQYCKVCSLAYKLKPPREGGLASLHQRLALMQVSLSTNCLV